MRTRRLGAKAPRSPKVPNVASQESPSAALALVVTGAESNSVVINSNEYVF